jgi:hypothetical protein
MSVYLCYVVRAGNDDLCVGGLGELCPCQASSSLK